jgi:hypothetical protein
MNTRNVPGGKGRPVRKADTSPPSVSRLFRTCGSLDVPRPLTGITLRFFTYTKLTSPGAYNHQCTVFTESTCYVLFQIFNTASSTEHVYRAIITQHLIEVFCVANLTSHQTHRHVDDTCQELELNFMRMSVTLTFSSSNGMDIQLPRPADRGRFLPL